MNFKSIKNRIYADYFMSSRLEEYERLLDKFTKNKFTFISLKDYYLNNFEEDDKIIILRHDIDSDLDISKNMFKIEDKYNIKSTYYFRLKTIDIDFMKELESKNIEIGYHFEELASFAKREKINTRDEVIARIDDIRDEFKDNIEFFKGLGMELKSISSHGDWKNRELDMRNLELLDEDLLKKYNIFEAYSIEDNLNFRAIDNPYPNFWVGGDPEDIIKENYKRSLLLVHPRNWDSCFSTRIKEDLGRIFKR